MQGREDSLSLILAAAGCRGFGNVKFGKQNEAVVSMDTGIAGSISPVVTAPPGHVCATQTECSSALLNTGRAEHPCCLSARKSTGPLLDTSLSKTRPIFLE